MNDAVIISVLGAAISVVFIPVITYFLVKRDQKVEEHSKEINTHAVELAGLRVEVRTLKERADRNSDRPHGPTSFTTETGK